MKGMLQVVQKKLLYLVHGLHCTKLPFHGRDSFINKSAGMDIPEIIQVSIYIQRKTMHGNRPADLNPDGAYLSCLSGIINFKPDASGSIQTRGNDSRKRIDDGYEYSP
jgi:hypothetical protein